MLKALRWVGYLIMAAIVAGGALALVSLALTIWFILRFVILAVLILALIAYALKELLSSRN